jgi:tetratricopeptide (TPR) repeat protein
VFRDAAGRGAAARAAHPDWARLRLADARLRAVYADALAEHFRRPDEAVPLYEAALAVFRPAQLADPGRVSAATELTKCLENYAVCLGRAGKPDDQRRVRDDALAVWDRLAKQFPDIPEYRLSRAVTLTNTAAELTAADLTRGDRPAEARLRDAVAELEWLAERYPRVPEYRDRLASALSNLAVLFTGTGRAGEAVPLFDRARLHVYVLAPIGPAAAAKRDGFFKLLKGRGLALWTLDRFAEAAESFAEAAKFAPAPLDWDEATALRLCMVVRGGRAADALREAVRLRGEGKLQGRGSVHAAAVFAEGAASSAVKGPEAKEALQQRAVSLIRAAVDAGYADPEQLRTLPAFRELVGRADFVEQVRRAGEKARPAPAKD